MVRRSATDYIPPAAASNIGDHIVKCRSLRKGFRRVCKRKGLYPRGLISGIEKAY